MRTLTLTILLLSLALFTGCASESQPNDIETGAPKIPAVSLWPGMTSIDARPVFPQELSTAKPIHAVVDIESLAYRAITIQHRISWIDASGKILNPDDKFKILNMAPRTKTRLDVVDPTGNAVVWRIEFRPAM